ncbi:hypothetical protein SNEBB_006188 [Seison nebaliae]|nr:hypothetical protein SNEBB_006188 [Seison nebaliae]
MNKWTRNNKSVSFVQYSVEHEGFLFIGYSSAEDDLCEGDVNGQKNAAELEMIHSLTNIVVWRMDLISYVSCAIDGKKASLIISSLIEWNEKNIVVYLKDGTFYFINLNHEILEKIEKFSSRGINRKFLKELKESLPLLVTNKKSTYLNKSNYTTLVYEKDISRLFIPKRQNEIVQFQIDNDSFLENYHINFDNNSLAQFRPTNEQENLSNFGMLIDMKYLSSISLLIACYENGTCIVFDQNGFIRSMAVRQIDFGNLEELPSKIFISEQDNFIRIFAFALQKCHYVSFELERNSLKFSRGKIEKIIEKETGISCLVSKNNHIFCGTNDGLIIQLKEMDDRLELIDRFQFHIKKISEKIDSSIKRSLERRVNPEFGEEGTNTGDSDFLDNISIWRMENCYYNLLGVNRNATNEEIKRAYRQKALLLHPDKNVDADDEVKEETGKLFLKCQLAHDTLMDVNKRKWYDDHREDILKSDGVDDVQLFQDPNIDLSSYFRNNCFNSFDTRNKNNFFDIFEELFVKLEKEDSMFIDIIYPKFQDGNCEYIPKIQEFYNFWLNYRCPQTCGWADMYDERTARNRLERRLILQENKRTRDAARNKRTKKIIELVKFVGKKDPRRRNYLEKMEKLKEEEEVKRRQRKEEQEKMKIKNIEEMQEKEIEQNYAEWEEFDDKLMELEMNYLTEEEKVEAKNYMKLFKSNDTTEEESVVEKVEEKLKELEIENYFCDICHIPFKSDGALQSHLSSKKHSKNLKMMMKKGLINEKTITTDNQTNNSTTTTTITTNDVAKKSEVEEIKEKEEDEEEDEEEVEESNNEPKISNRQRRQQNKKAKLISHKEEILEKSSDIVKSLQCGICYQLFESRNQLFGHIKDTGHSVTPSVASKMNKRAYKKKMNNIK